MLSGNSKSKEVFDRIMFRADEKKVPVFAHLDLSYKCNLKCIHCYCQNLSADFSRYKEELSPPEICRLLDELAEAGSLYLGLSGGEVLIHPHFFEIARYARRKGFWLTVLTNGTLIDEDVAQRLAELMPRAIDLSIYGTSSEVHDAITQSPGSFDKVVRAVNLLKKEKIRVVLKTIVMKSNLHQAQQIFEFAKNLGADDHYYTAEVTPRNDGSRVPKKNQLGREEMRSFLSGRKEALKGDPAPWPDDPLSKPICGAGTLGCYVSPYGDVYPCIQLLVPMGNTREQSFKEIWFNPSPAREILDPLKTYQDMPLCRDCGYVKTCAKCLGIAYLETMDVKGCYELLKYTAKIEHELLSETGV